MWQPLVDPDADPEVRKLVQEFARERWGRVSALYGMLLHQPEVARSWLGLGGAVRKRTSLDDRIRELTICLVARVMDQSFEFENHAPIALRAGATEAELAALLDRGSCATFSERDLALLDFAEQVTRGSVTEARFAAAAQHFSPPVLVEIATTAAYYLATARFLDAFGIVAGTEGLVVAPESAEDRLR
jgi:alkylhydroperoxidase family enzyme